MEKQAAYAEELVTFIKMGKRMVVIYAEEFKQLQELSTGRIIWLFEKMKEHEANIFSELKSLSALIKDPRIKAEMESFLTLFSDVNKYVAADRNKVRFLIHYINFYNQYQNINVLNLD